MEEPMDNHISEFAKYLNSGYERWRADMLALGWRSKDASATQFSKIYGWKAQSWSAWTLDQSLPDVKSLINMVKCTYLGPEVLDKLNMFSIYGPRITAIQKKLFTASDQKLDMIEKVLTAGEGDELKLDIQSS
jgi:hypothetical protein